MRGNRPEPLMEGNVLSDRFPQRKPLTPKRHHLQEKRSDQRSAYDFPDENDENQDPALNERHSKRQCTASVRPGAPLQPPQPGLCSGNEATDFTQLFQNIRKEPLRKGSRQDAITSFDDIASRPSQKEGPGLQYGSQLTALFRQEVSRPAESSHLDLPPRPTKQPKTLQNLADIPADQTLKTCLRFSSSRPFDCCRAATLANSSSVTQVMEDFCCSRERTSNTLQEQWQESLLSWQYPDSTLTPMTAAVLVGQKGSSFMDDRRATWQTAFSSLYYGLRQGRCPAFYFVTPEASDRHSRELKDLGQGVRGPSMAGLDNSSQSLLKFSGPRDVHGIYNWLLDSGLGGLSDTADVARLLSPVPFLGASLLRSSFKILPLATHAEPGKESTYRIEVRGLLPPWNVRKMFKVLQKSQTGSFQVLIETESLSSNLNVHCAKMGTEKAGEEDGDKLGLMKGIEEAMHCCYLRELRCTDVKFDARVAPA